MNPLTNIRNQNRLNEREVNFGLSGGNKNSWHEKYRNSAWIYIGGLPYGLNEGDVLSVFSQYGEIVNINLIRDRKTGKSRGFAFICYEDQRSTILAVDNFNGINLLKRTIRVDHVEQYKVPKYNEDVDEEIRRVWEEGCAPKPVISQEDEEEEEVDPLIRMAKKGKLDEDGVLKLNDDLAKKMKEERKRAKKEAKRLKKEMRRLKKEEISDYDPSKIKKKTIDDVDWRLQKKSDSPGLVKDDDIYGKNEHFNFGKPKKEIPPPPSHNPRPDFEKASWRDIEIWKAVKEREKVEKGNKETVWKEEEHYLPKRFHRD